MAAHRCLAISASTSFPCEVDWLPTVLISVDADCYTPKQRRWLMAERKRARREPLAGNPAGGTRYSATGHPSIEELMAEQGTAPITDVRALHGDFWPEEESIEDFLAALHE
jgi:hypothetical protein